MAVVLFTADCLLNTLIILVLNNNNGDRGGLVKTVLLLGYEFQGRGMCGEPRSGVKRLTLAREESLVELEGLDLDDFRRKTGSLREQHHIVFLRDNN